MSEIPIDLRNATRLDDRRGVGTPSSGIGEAGDPSYPIGTTSSPAVAYSIYPESGQGADLVATETELAPAITATDGEATTDRGLRVLAYRKAQKAHDPDDCERWEEADVAGTLAGHSTTTGEAVVTELAVRRLTELECERLQGFPDGWTEGHSGSARYRFLGDAVAVPNVEWIARRIARCA